MEHNEYKSLNVDYIFSSTASTLPQTRRCFDSAPVSWRLAVPKPDLNDKNFNFSENYKSGYPQAFGSINLTIRLGEAG
jgi:hypothetical protein